MAERTKKISVYLLNCHLNKEKIIKKIYQIKKMLANKKKHFLKNSMSKIILIGKKLGMTSLFAGDSIIPVTLVKILPNNVVETKKYKNKTNLVLAGNKEVNPKKVNKPQRNDFEKKGLKCRETVKEFEIDEGLNFATNTEMSVGDYLKGALVDVRGATIGKGFQGAMKRWGFGGLPASHGVSLTHRSLGSTGNRTLPGRVFKGKKMAGHMGNKNICVQNMVVCKVDKDTNIIAIKGSIPGKKNSVVYITNAVKKYTERDNVVNGIACEG